MSRVLGIDPGIRCLGWGIVESAGGDFRAVEAGIVQPPVDAPIAERLLHIEQALDAVIARLAPDTCAVENIFYHKNARSMLMLGRAQAAAILCAARAGLELSLYSPSEVKQSVTGNGRAGKEQVRFMVERILNFDCGEQPDDLSDALAVAICHAGRSQDRRKGIEA